MTTPICDFVRGYAARRPVRLHMPGHKGVALTGPEPLDITEIDGADDLFAPEGLIAESEANASRLFGARTFYSTEGSSLAIRAMLSLALRQAPRGERPLVLAGRNAHRAFMSAAALLDFDVQWLNPKPGDACHGCTIRADEVAGALDRLGGRCRAVYLTSPDYLGHTQDIRAVAAACRRGGAALLVDNAHGAYLRFLSPSRHPIDLGADMCCDSAHKTLPALTGAAYLHLRRAHPATDREVRDALALFGSSSPSWLILQSLDACNRCLETFPDVLAGFLPKLAVARAAIAGLGFPSTGDEPMKLSLAARPMGYTGDELAALLVRRNIYPEFHDPDFLTLMPTPQNTDGELARLVDALAQVPRRDALPDVAPPWHALERAMSIRDAAFAPRQTLPVEACLGRVLASPAVSCPPCVPVAVCGERLDAGAIRRLRYYGIAVCDVVTQPRP